MHLCFNDFYEANRGDTPPNLSVFLLAHRKLVDVALQHSLQVELLQLPLQAGWQAGIHGGASGQDDVLEEVSPDQRNKR